MDGLGAELLALCDTYVRIPMLGRKHSLNVATAGGVVIYELLRKYRRMLESAKRDALTWMKTPRGPLRCARGSLVQQ